MHVFQLMDRFAPVQLAETCRRDDKAVQYHVLSGEPCLNALDDVMELDLLVAWAFMLEAVGLNESQVLSAVLHEPTRVVGIKIPCLNEAHPAPAALSAKQE